MLHLSVRAILRRAGEAPPVVSPAGVRFADASVGGRVNDRDVGGHSLAGEGWLRTELERIRSGGALPYGVAIAIGGCYALLISLGG